VCRQTDEKDFNKKLKDLERIINKKDKEFLKGLMDEKEKWALAYDKGGKHCRYMTSNMAEIFNSVLRGVRSLHVTTIVSFTFYKCNEWFMKWLVDAQMVQTHHSDYVVAPNIYLDTKRYEGCVKGTTQLALTFKSGSMRSSKAEERHPAVNTAGLSGSR
jgi:hypothetical protein